MKRGGKGPGPLSERGGARVRVAQVSLLDGGGLIGVVRLAACPDPRAVEQVLCETKARVMDDCFLVLLRYFIVKRMPPISHLSTPDTRHRRG